ncbi:hypothetical protein CKN86_13280 [Carnobacterium divergens]|uniref:CPBP family intramembrane glutamic endopeptidase n=2 Tax=Carnobacterium divergens TaxID=2748 RepID=UPI000D497992|nr:CPBP family intramembrane metalloprotease [Carnobacterium divergens]TFI62087.1 hypothetical protein CKN62_07735 [Carnobacterium divergens]TFI86771.1 hypothetical protein CKN84_13775 [Carnobacterium divergens]TFJ01831.1 hypothetical protein CKN86_13280 [Carnobacterium divergens]TFJ02243.1 hypothetical protein CKN65_13955 [Carnobacterium divergens]
MIVIFTLVFIISNIMSLLIRKFVRGNMYLRIVRIVTIDLFYLSIFLFFPFPNISTRVDILPIIIVFFLSAILRFIDYEQLKRSLKKSYMKFQPRTTLGNLISRSGEVFIIPVIEELFYRGTIPINSSKLEILIFCIISMVLFNLAHYIGRKSDLKYHLKITVFSIISTLIYLYTGNLAYSILFHVLYNLPWFFIYLRKYKYNIGL